MEKIWLIGNLTRDPELTETSAGVSVCRFTVAVNRRSQDGETADFFNVTAWRALAESVSRYTKKGNKVGVAGDLQIRTYEANDGSRRISVDVIAQEVEFLTPKQEERRDGFGEEERRSVTRQSEPRHKPKLQSFDDDGDIPF